MAKKGFTLIELVMVLVLLGIVAVFVAPKLGDVTATKAGAFADKLRADIRYAQNLAMTMNQRYRVYFNAAPAPVPNGYAVVNDADSDANWGEAGEFALDPAGGGNLSVTLNAGDYAGITVASSFGNFLEFNSLGTPTVGGGTVTVNGDPTLQVTITSQTGAVN